MATETVELTHEIVNQFKGPVHTLDILIAKAAGWHVITLEGQTSYFLCSGERLYENRTLGFNDTWMYAPFFSFDGGMEEMLKIVGAYTWRTSRLANGAYVVTMSKTLEGPTVTVCEETLAFALAKAWLHLQVKDDGAVKGETVEQQEKLDLLRAAEQVIARAAKYDSTPDHFELLVSGSLGQQELQALDALGTARNMLWQRTIIDKSAATTFVRYQRPTGKAQVTRITTDYAG